MEENELDSTCGVPDDELTKRDEVSGDISGTYQKYDDDLGLSYLEYPNGRREYAKEA